MKITPAMLIVTLSVPFAAAQAALVSVNQLIAVYSGIAALFFTPLIYLMAKGQRWALYLTVTIGALWCLASGITALALRSPSVGFFTVFLVFFWFMLWQRLQYDLGRPFFDSGKKWYQGMAATIPGISCSLTQGQRQFELKVSRIDYDGAFVFSQNGSMIDLNKVHDAELLFAFRNRQIRLRGVPIRVLKNGAGFCFANVSPDTRKDLGDFVETLRGEGYVF